LKRPRNQRANLQTPNEKDIRLVSRRRKEATEIIAIILSTALAMLQLIKSKPKSEETGLESGAQALGTGNNQSSAFSFDELAPYFCKFRLHEPLRLF
jgi:hypothetical protein